MQQGQNQGVTHAHQHYEGILTQPDWERWREKWIEILLEYDLEVKIMKLVKGQGLDKLMAQSNYDALILHMIIELSAEEQNPQNKPGPPVGDHFLSSPWYIDVIFIPQHL